MNFEKKKRFGICFRLLTSRVQKLMILLKCVDLSFLFFCTERLVLDLKIKTVYLILKLTSFYTPTVADPDYNSHKRIILLLQNHLSLRWALNN